MSAAMANASLSATSAPPGFGRSSQLTNSGLEGAGDWGQTRALVSFGGVAAAETEITAANCGVIAGRGRLSRRDRDVGRRSLGRDITEWEQKAKREGRRNGSVSGSCNCATSSRDRRPWICPRMKSLTGGEEKGNWVVPEATAGGGATTVVANRPASVVAQSPSAFVEALLHAQELSAKTAPPENPSTFQSLDSFSLKRECKEALEGLRWPSNRDEEYRFTDLRPLLTLTSSESASTSASDGKAIDISRCKLEEANGSRLVVVDGVVSPSLSSLHALQEAGVIVGASSSLSDDSLLRFVAPHLGRLSGESASGSTKPDVFSLINGAAARDLTVVRIPEGVKLEIPIHIVYYASSSSSSSDSSEEDSSEKNTINLSNPRTLVVVERGAEVDIVEEFVGDSAGLYWSNSVTECVLEEAAKLRHGYVQEQSRGAFHIKRTTISQEEASSYSLIEAEVGGRISRHNLQILQLGPDTQTSVSTFLLAGRKQLHDLHSSIVLNHPRGKTSQLHKCIVADSTGHGVFDGNVKVNRFAQQTDAGQLSRNLLLAPRATVNVKPNLQIIADDVKCTHGATISDLEEDQLFYFRARGIDAVTARSALVFSFGAEVLEKFPYRGLTKRLETTVTSALADEGALGSSVMKGLM